MDGKPLLYVEWIDHCSFTDVTWRDLDEYRALEAVEVKSIGWLLKEDDTCIVLVSTISDDSDNGFGDILILKSAIKHRKELS